MWFFNLIFQIVIGIIIQILSLIPRILLVQLFRRIQSRRKRISPSHSILSKVKRNSESFDEDEKKKSKKKKCSLSFPWWWIFIAYGLCIIIVAVSIFFIIARGIEFGNLETKKWLTSMVTGLLSSIFILDPIKVKFSFLFVYFNYFVIDFMFSNILLICLSKV